MGKRIQCKRKSLNLSQEDLSQKLNVTRSAISNWEIDRNYPDLQTIVNLSQILEIPIDYLLSTSTEEEIKDAFNKKK